MWSCQMQDGRSKFFDRFTAITGSGPRMPVTTITFTRSYDSPARGETPRFTHVRGHDYSTIAGHQFRIFVTSPFAPIAIQIHEPLLANVAAHCIPLS